MASNALEAPDAIAHLSAADPHIAAVIATIGSFSLNRRPDPFYSLVEAIISQQLAGAAAATIYSRFLQIYDGNPSPKAVSATEGRLLRKAGISSRKVEYIKHLSKSISDRTLDLDALQFLDDEEVIAKLTAVRGIGRWTAEMFLIFCLGRMDVLPVGDLGLRKAVQQVYGLRTLPAPAQVRRIAACWKPYSTVATWYLWKSLRKFNAI